MGPPYRQTGTCLPDHRVPPAGFKPGADLEAEALAQFINDNAPYFFVPRYIEFVDSLPYTPTNKVQKFKLREAGVTPDTWDGRAAGFKAQR